MVIRARILAPPVVFLGTGNPTGSPTSFTPGVSVTVDVRTKPAPATTGGTRTQPPPLRSGSCGSALERKGVVVRAVAFGPERRDEVTPRGRRGHGSGAAEPDGKGEGKREHIVLGLRCNGPEEPHRLATFFRY